MAGGYTGKILRINLTTRAINTMDSKPYNDKYGGAHGVGAAIFWDLAVESGWDMQDGFDPRNVVTLMVGPLAGTNTPCVGRTEVQGVGPQKWPIEWFTRSGFGGRWGANLKWAGWDGVVIEGAATSPVWINIINDNVTIEDAGPDGDNLWGLSTWDAQKEIWKKIRGSKRSGEWQMLPGGEFTTQVPAVVACGPVGESLARVGSLVHDGGSGAGQGGFGGVFGSKNLKAISVLGTGSVPIDDPASLVDTRMWYRENYSYNVDDPTRPGAWRAPTHGASSMNFTDLRRPSGCSGSSFNCRQQSYTGESNGSQCSDVWLSGGNRRNAANNTDLGQKYGINLFGGTGTNRGYLNNLYNMGELGIGATIDSAPLQMSTYFTRSWAEAFLQCIADREGIGDTLAEGQVRMANAWGRYEEDSGPGRLLNTIHWGDNWHHSAEKWWLFGGLYGDRDCNEHCTVYSSCYIAGQRLGTPDEISPEELANEMAEGNPGPWTGDPYMWSQTWQGPNGEWMDDALETGWYSPSGAREVAWHRYYSRFYQQGMGMCCWNWGIAFGNFHCMQNPQYEGGTAGGAEPRFINSVTGLNISFEDGMDIGRRVWNLDRAIWVLQGRHRDMEHFTASRQYEAPGTSWGGRAMPSYRNGVWEYQFYNTPDEAPFCDRDAMEVLNDNYYALEGWGQATGWPTRATLESLDLGFVADKLQAENKLGV